MSTLFAFIGDISTGVEGHHGWRPTALAAVTVGWGVRYNTAGLTGRVSSCANGPAHSVTLEHSPTRTGGRAMAHVGHGRGVSRPRWARSSCQGTSRRQRSPNHASSWTGLPLRSVHSRA
jgi:hypothetical protein